MGAEPNMIPYTYVLGEVDAPTIAAIYAMLV